MRAGAAALAGLVMFASLPAMALEALPDDFFLVTISNASDDHLNAARVACAFGDITNVVENIRSHNIKTQIIAKDYCPAVVAEAARRGNHGDLYGRMQHEMAADEMKLILMAASQGQHSYINAEGQERELSCEMAFDMGYMYGDANPNKAILADWSDAALKRVVKRCYERLVKESTKATFLVAARLAQIQKGN